MTGPDHMSRILRKYALFLMIAMSPVVQLTMTEQAHADEIMLKHGGTIETEYCWEEGETVFFKNAGGIVGINKASIERIVKTDYLTKGYTLAHSGEYRRALEAYDKAIKQNPNGALGYTGRGSCYAQLGNYDLALADFDKGIRIDPSEWRAYANRALVYCSLRAFDSALQDYDKALQLNPHFVDGYANRGWICRNYLKDSDRAIIDFTRSIQLDPTYSLVYFHRACAHLDVRQYSKAAEDLTTALKTNPQFGEAYMLRGFVYEEYLNNPQQAEQDFKVGKSLVKQQAADSKGMPFRRW